MFATVVNTIPPAITFVGLAVMLGITLSIVTKRVIPSSLIASALVATAFVTMKRQLPFDFLVYAQDIVYEPLIRDHFLRHPVEGIASSLFHFGVPYLAVAGVMRWLRQRQQKRNKRG